jgi:hypothetical protein
MSFIYNASLIQMHCSLFLQLNASTLVQQTLLSSRPDQELPLRPAVAGLSPGHSSYLGDV